MPMVGDSKRNRRTVTAVSRRRARLDSWRRPPRQRCRYWQVRRLAGTCAHAATVPAFTLQVAEAIPRYRRA